LSATPRLKERAGTDGRTDGLVVRWPATLGERDCHRYVHRREECPVFIVRIISLRAFKDETCSLLL
jgi:hypothetical protein